MRWQKRLVGLLIAAGAVGLGACSNSSDDVPCGEAMDDPCICGRPEIGPAEAALCSEEKSCEAQGGIFQANQIGPDGGYGLCSVDAGSSIDAEASEDGGRG